MSLSPGATIAGFRVIRSLGEGGFGTVYLVQHPTLPRRDVLKVAHGSMAGDPSFRMRFEREAHLAAALDHPNIVQVYDQGTEGDLLWIRMQYVEGTDAAHLVTEGPVAPQRALHIVRSIGSALDHAHRTGLLHRDVKPANILLASPRHPDEPERVLLTDFGIATSIKADVKLTRTGQAFLTPAYAAPERYSSEALDGRVDVYSLGCVLFELLTGRLPYPQQDPIALLAAHDRAPIPDPRKLQPELPEGVTTVIQMALAKDRRDRYLTCRRLVDALTAAFRDPVTPSASQHPVPLTSVDPRHASAADRTTGLPSSGAIDSAPTRPADDTEPTSQRAMVSPPGARWPDSYRQPPSGSPQSSGSSAAMLPPGHRIDVADRQAWNSTHRPRRHVLRWLIILVTLVVVVIGAGIGTHAWALQHWFVGADGTGSDAHVAVFRGLHTSPLGIDLYRLDESTDLPVTDLAPDYRDRVRDGIEAESADDADRILAALRAHRLPLCQTPGATDNSSGGVVHAGVDCREG